MNFHISKKICIERAGKVVAAFEADTVERAIINGNKSDNLFVVTQIGCKHNLIKINDDDTVEQTNFGQCRAITDFDEDGIARIFLYTTHRHSSPYLIQNYINTDLKLLFDNKYNEVIKIDKNRFKVCIIENIGTIFSPQIVYRYGVIDQNGEEILECKYSEIRYNKIDNTFEAKL